jgi:hypothetical protein
MIDELNDKLHECVEHTKLDPPEEFDDFALPRYPDDVNIFIGDTFSWMYVGSEYAVQIVYCPYCGIKLE